MRPPGKAQELERRRIRAVQLFKQGKSPTRISEYLGCSRSSVYRWIEQAKAGPDGLRSIPVPGRPRKLSPRQHRQLERLLLKGATAHGWPNELWTASRVTQIIRRHFGVLYHPEHVRYILKQRLGWSSQKPEQRARERDENEIGRWKREEFPRIKKSRA